MGGVGARGLPVRRIVGVVAPLAPAAKVFVCAMLWAVIEVPNGEDHERSRDGMGLAVFRSAVGVRRAAFTTPLATDAFRERDLRPIFGVSVALIRPNRHR